MRCGPRLIQWLSKRCNNIDLPDEQADSFCLLTEQGTAPSGMVNAMREMGFRRSEIKTECSLENLEYWIRGGAVVTVCYLDGGKADGHWSSVLHVNGTTLTIYDPDCGVRLVPHENFVSHWMDYEIKDKDWILWNRCAVIGYPDCQCDVT